MGEQMTGLTVLGEDVHIRYTGWGQYERAGVEIWHRCQVQDEAARCRELGPDGGTAWCVSGALFDLPGIREAFMDRTLWTVVQAEPLTVGQSFACPHGPNLCAFHGYIRDGRWASA